MEIAEISYLIKQRLALITMVTLASMAAIFFVITKQPSSYEASSILTVQAKREDVSQYQYGGFYAIQSSELFVNTIIGWLKSENIVGSIYQKAGITVATEDLSEYGKNIYARKVPPQNISVVITDTHPDRIQKIADATVSVIQERTQAISSVAESSADFEIIPTPFVIQKKDSNTVVKTVAVGIFIGIILTLLSLLAELVSRKVNSPFLAKRIFGSHAIKLSASLLKKNHPLSKKLREKMLFVQSFMTQDGQWSNLAVTDTVNAKKAAQFAYALAKTLKEQKNKVAIIDLSSQIDTVVGKKPDAAITEVSASSLEKVTKLIHSEKGVQLFSIKESDDVILSQAQVSQLIDNLSKYFDQIITILPPLNHDSRYAHVMHLIKQAVVIIEIKKSLISDSQYLSEFMQTREIKNTVVALTK